MGVNLRFVPNTESQPNKFQFPFKGIMDRCHEFGLITYWEDHYLDDIRLIPFVFVRLAFEDEKIYLDFIDIGPFFLILVVGFSIAFLALFGEILYHEYLLHLMSNKPSC